MVSVWLPVPVSLLFFFFCTLPISSTYNLHIYEVMCVTLSYIILYYLIPEIMHLWNFCYNIFLLTLEIMSFAINKNIILHSFFCRLSPDQDTGKVTQHIEFDAYDVNEFEYKLNVWVPFLVWKPAVMLKLLANILDFITNFLKSVGKYLIAFIIFMILNYYLLLIAK